MCRNSAHAVVVWFLKQQRQRGLHQVCGEDTVQIMRIHRAGKSTKNTRGGYSAAKTLQTRAGENGHSAVPPPPGLRARLRGSAADCPEPDNRWPEVMASTCAAGLSGKRSSCPLPSKTGCDRFRERSSPVNLARITADPQRGLNRVFALVQSAEAVAWSRLLRRLRTGSLTRTRERAGLIGNWPRLPTPLQRRYGRPALSVLCDPRPAGPPEIAEEERSGVTPWRESNVIEFCPRKNGGGRPRERNIDATNRLP